MESLVNEANNEAAIVGEEGKGVSPASDSSGSETLFEYRSETSED